MIIKSIVRVSDNELDVTHSATDDIEATEIPSELNEQYGGVWEHAGLVESTETYNTNRFRCLRWK